MTAGPGTRGTCSRASGRVPSPAAAEPTYLSRGLVLQDRYEIAEEIGRGGYSVVYRARDRRVGTDVAIKLLVPPPAAARLARERLRREVQAVRQLSHPHIVAVYDVADDGPWSFVVMEFVAGHDLAVRVRQGGPLDSAAAARVGREIAAALGAAHRRGIVHRDVKPSNILLEPDGRARLTDFGSARLAGEETVTQSGGFVGTLDYAAPEVLAGGRGDARADGYALGVTLYYALTGELPARTTARVAPEPHHGGYRPRQRRPDLPAWLDEVVARATTPDPEDRFPAVALLADAIDRGDAEGDAPDAPPLQKESCVLCRAPDPFGIGVCPRCADRASGGGDGVLVFLERTTPGPARRAVLDVLEARVGSRASSAAREAVAAGERPLLRVPRRAVPRVLELLETRGLSASAEAAGAAWHAAVPRPIAVLAGLVIVGGVAAGLAAAAPLLFMTSPAVAVALVGVAAVGRRTPVWRPASPWHSPLPAEAEQAAVHALAVLPAGHARALLIDLIRRATAMTAASAAAERVAPLVVAASTAASELAALEQHLAAFDAQRPRLSDAPAGWLDALSRCERGRDLLTQRLLEASAALSRWHAAALEAGGEGGSLAGLARDLDEEGRRQEEARREIAALLA